MKKSLIFAACAIAAMTACTKNEVFVNENASKISFTAPVVQLNTKAVAGEQPGADGKYATGENFMVFASWTKNDYAADDWGTALYMPGVKVSYNVDLGTKGGWEPADAYYWPKTGKLTFAAYSPADLSNDAATITYDKSGLKVSGFTVKDNTADQYDFMYAERSYNRTSSTNTSEAGHGHTAQSYEGVDIIFHHALSSIVFKVKADANITNTKFTVKKVEILNAQNKGDFAETITDGPTYVSAPVWSNQAGKVNYTVWGGSETLVPTADAKELNDVSDVLLLPQTLAKADGNVTVRVEYSIKRTEEYAPEIEQEAVFDLSSAEYNKGTENGTAVTVDKWEMGKRYTYNIFFSLDKIYFAPEVTNWVDVTMDEITVK